MVEFLLRVIYNFKKTIIVTSVILVQSLNMACHSKQTSLNKYDDAKKNVYIPYYVEVSKADSLKIIGKNEEAFEKLDLLFRQYKPRNSKYVYELKVTFF